ncbi:MAG: DM13 domain-containing protein [Ahrensia sp.]|nr:DM13 domain-containing protein [Ahrensia sp.]
MMKLKELFAVACLAASAFVGLSLISANLAAAETIAKGTFFGQSNHVTTGIAVIEKDGDKTLLILGDDFSLDGAPAPTIGFSSGGTFDKATEFTKLQKLTGRQIYEMPATIDVSKYDQVTIWCADFSVPLGSADLKR